MMFVPSFLKKKEKHFTAKLTSLFYLFICWIQTEKQEKNCLLSALSTTSSSISLRLHITDTLEFTDTVIRENWKTAPKVNHCIPKLTCVVRNCVLDDRMVKK